MRLILQKNKENPHLSAPKINNSIKFDHGVHMGNETVRQILRDNNIDGRVARKKPLISKTKKGKRLDFAKTFESKPDEF